MRLCTVTLVLAYGAYSLCTSLPMFYGCSVVVGLSLGGVTSVPLSLLISNWFHEAPGLAIGVAFMGSGVGGMVFNPIVSSLLQNMGLAGYLPGDGAGCGVAGSADDLLCDPAGPGGDGLNPPWQRTSPLRGAGGGWHVVPGRQKRRRGFTCFACAQWWRLWPVQY